MILSFATFQMIDVTEKTDLLRVIVSFDNYSIILIVENL